MMDQSQHTLHTPSMIRDVAVLPDGRIITAHTNGDATLKLWHLLSGEVLRVFEGHRLNAYCLAVIDAQRIVSGSADKTLRVWDLETGQTITLMQGHILPITDVAVLDAQHILSSSHDGRVGLWHVERTQALRYFVGHTAAVNAVIALDAHRFATASSDGSARLWDIRTGQVIHQLTERFQHVQAIAALDSERMALAAQGKGGGLYIWTPASGILQQLYTSTDFAPDAITCLNTQQIIHTRGSNNLHIYDLNNPAHSNSLTGHTDRIHAVHALDNTRLISAGTDCTVRIWDI